MAVTKETLQRMVREMGMVPVSEEEIEVILPALNHFLEDIQKLRALDLSGVRSHIFRAEPDRW